MFLVRILFAGIIFLFLTILVNMALGALKLYSWYDFLGAIQSKGVKKAISRMPAVSLLWLFIGYPFVLGLFVYILRGLIQ